MIRKLLVQNNPAVVRFTAVITDQVRMLHIVRNMLQHIHSFISYSCPEVAEVVCNRSQGGLCRLYSIPSTMPLSLLDNVPFSEMRGSNVHQGPRTVRGAASVCRTPKTVDCMPYCHWHPCCCPQAGNKSLLAYRSDIGIPGYTGELEILRQLWSKPSCLYGRAHACCADIC
jgi:hypothetical protein